MQTERVGKSFRVELEVRSMAASREQGRGGMIYRGYTVTFPRQILRIIAFEMPDGKLEQFIVSASN